MRHSINFEQISKSAVLCINHDELECIKCETTTESLYVFYDSLETKLKSFQNDIRVHTHNIKGRSVDYRRLIGLRLGKDRFFSYFDTATALQFFKMMEPYFKQQAEDDTLGCIEIRVLRVFDITSDNNMSNE